jgi:signal transduction histidine kinase
MMTPPYPGLPWRRPLAAAATVILAVCPGAAAYQARSNLLVNAARAVAATDKGDEDEGRIRVGTSGGGGCLKVEVADTGIGIPEKHRGKIFDPFFTTKEVGEGTGQGLAIAQQIIVEKHGGAIDFQSEAGVGTAATQRIPFGAPA